MCILILALLLQKSVMKLLLISEVLHQTLPLCKHYVRDEE